MRKETSGRALTAIVALALLASLIVAVPGAVAQDPADPEPLRTAENVRMGDDPRPARGRDIPGMAVNPDDPDHIVVVDKDFINATCEHHVSFDGGVTWETDELTGPAGFPTPVCTHNFDSGGYAQVNESVAFGSGDTVYTTFSSHRGEFQRPESGIIAGEGDDILVARSTDGGQTFEPGVVAVPGGPDPQPFFIRPQLAVAPDGEGDRVVVSGWVCFVTSGGCQGGGGERRIITAVSDDGGQTWNDPVVASGPEESAREPSQPVIGPDGTLYVAWRNRDPATEEDPNHMVVASSTDDGQTWTREETAPITGGGGHPKLAIDPADPAGTGTLYLTFTSLEFGDFDVVLQRSTDGGASWSAPLRVNDDGPGTVQRASEVHVADDGRVDVVWHDRRHAFVGLPLPAPRGMGDTYYAYSTDGGESFSVNRRVTDRTINLDVGLDRRVGTYIWYGPTMAQLSSDELLFVWPDSREGNFHTDTQDLYLARMSLDASGPVPVSHLTPVGADSTAVSVAQSQLAYPGGVEQVGPVAMTRVVIVNDEDVAGALAGGVLARAFYGPVLASPAAGLPEEVADEVARLQAEGAYVVGDTSSLSAQVITDLEAAGVPADEIERVDAGSPAATAAAIAGLMDARTDEAKDAGQPAFSAAVIANPDSEEAATASAMAAALHLPVLFVDAGAVPAATQTALEELDIDATVVVGGTDVVSAPVADGLPDPQRLDGADLLATSQAVADESAARGLPVNIVYAASDPMHAAVMGAGVARLGGLLVLAEQDSDEAVRGAVDTLDASALVDRIVVASTQPDPTTTPTPTPDPTTTPTPTPDPTTTPTPTPTPTPGPDVVCPEGLAPAVFTDRSLIPAAHRDNVDCAAHLEIVQGFADGTYGPTLQVRRDQMASFIARGLDAIGVDLPEPTDQRFTDVAADSAHDANIHRLAAASIVQGGAGGLAATSYGPEQLVRRDQMASFLLRAAAFATGQELASQTAAFPDVGPSNSHFANVNGASETGLTQGFADGTYRPADGVRRDQMGSFIIRLLTHIEDANTD